MATIKSETLSLHIDVIGGDKARSEMNALTRSIKDTTAELDSLLKKQKQLEAQGKKDSAQYRETTKLIEEKTAAVRDAEAKLDALRRQQDISSMTMTELRKRAKELSAALSKIDPNTELWNKVNKQLRETKTRLDELKGTLHRAEDIEKLTNELVFAVRSMLLALPGRVAMDLAAISNPAEVSTYMARHVSTLLDELATHEYNPDAYAQLVREREGWRNDKDDDGDDDDEDDI